MTLDLQRTWQREPQLIEETGLGKIPLIEKLLVQFNDLLRYYFGIN